MVKENQVFIVDDSDDEDCQVISWKVNNIPVIVVSDGEERENASKRKRNLNTAATSATASSSSRANKRQNLKRKHAEDVDESRTSKRLRNEAETEANKNISSRTRSHNHRSDKDFLCPFCANTAINTQNLAHSFREHFIKVHLTKYFKCKQCNVGFNDPVETDEHYSCSGTSKHLVGCPFCQNRSQKMSISDLIDHVGCFHTKLGPGNQSELLHCGIQGCKTMFNTFLDNVNHFLSTHEQQRTITCMISCPLCDKLGLNYKSGLEHYLRFHRDSIGERDGHVLNTIQALCYGAEDLENQPIENSSNFLKGTSSLPSASKNTNNTFPKSFSTTYISCTTRSTDQSSENDNTQLTKNSRSSGDSSSTNGPQTCCAKQAKDNDSSKNARKTKEALTSITDNNLQSSKDSLKRSLTEVQRTISTSYLEGAKSSENTSKKIKTTPSCLSVSKNLRTSNDSHKSVLSNGQETISTSQVKVHHSSKNNKTIKTTPSCSTISKDLQTSSDSLKRSSINDQQTTSQANQHPSSKDNDKVIKTTPSCFTFNKDLQASKDSQKCSSSNVPTTSKSKETQSLVTTPKAKHKKLHKRKQLTQNQQNTWSILSNHKLTTNGAPESSVNQPTGSMSTSSDNPHNLRSPPNNSKFVRHLSTFSHILFLDFDNWGRLFETPTLVPDRVFVWMFCGGDFNARRYKKSPNYIRLLAENRLYFHPRCGRTKDAADFALCVQAARLDLQLPTNIPFTVLSGDHGFGELTNQLSSSAREIHLINPHFKPLDFISCLLHSIADK